MLDNVNLLALMKATASAKPSGVYSFNGASLSGEAMNETLRNELNELMGTEDLYQENKRKVFKLMEQVLDEVVPARLGNAYGQFAEVNTYAQGTKPVFKRRTGKTRAKQFVTRVGLAGVYEVFKLGMESFEVPTSAIGSAAQIGFEEFLDGRADFAELTQIVMDGMDELIYKEIIQALVAAVNALGTNDKVTAANFSESEMDKQIAKARAYGTPTIYCDALFAATMIPSENRWSDAMKDQMWATGHLGNYKGTRVVILPNTMEDETNTKWALDPSYAFIIPTGANDRPVKVAFEGATHAREVDANADWSREIQIYRKVGVGVQISNNLFAYQNTSLKQTV